MGSDWNVAVAIKKEYFLLTGLAAEVAGRATRHENREGVLLVWDSIRWNDVYEDIAAFQDALKGIPKAHWYFVALGENDRDIRVSGKWRPNSFNLRVLRSIGMDVTP
jgi:hypothetical protein